MLPVRGGAKDFGPQIALGQANCGTSSEEYLPA